MTSLSRLPRVPLVSEPTPLQHAPLLSDALGVDIWLKRDDMTGVGLGGNKVRALEFLLGEAVREQCDCLVTGAGPQSNWAMLAALCARRIGIDPYLVYYGNRPRSTGNLRLAEVTGADIRFTGELDRASVDHAINALSDELRAAGRRPYTLPRGGATALGAVGYMRASLELADQLRAAELTPTQLWLATGSCATQAGLIAGTQWLCAPYQVVGVTVSRPRTECLARIAALARDALDLIGLRDKASDRSAPIVVDGYSGPGYGRASAAGEAAARLVAWTEAVFLDPVFGAKAMAALTDVARAGELTGPVVFLVTGGAPTLFVNRKAQS